MTSNSDLGSSRPHAGSPRTTRPLILALLAYAALAVVLTYPQIRFLTRVPDHTDPLFSVWRLGWVAHQVVTHPTQIFHANIFHPEQSTFAYSDAMLLPALMTAPFLWAGIHPVVVYNLAMLAALALSGLTMFLLARHLCRHDGAAFLAGMIFAFAPYRFEQYIHIEMETVMWIPLVLLQVHRTLARPTAWNGLSVGLTLAAQILSGMYGALNLLVALVVFVPVLALSSGAPPVRQWWKPIAAAAVCGVLVAPYAMVYSRVAAQAGPRSTTEIRHYGASIGNYFAAPPMNRLYGATATRGGEELHLFPGATPLLLGVIGLVVMLASLKTPRSRAVVAYVAMLLFSLEAARGFDGVSYPLMYQYVAPLQALRVPARFDLLVNLALGILAATGLASLLSRAPRWCTTWVPALLIAMVAAEYASSPTLVAVAPPSPADRWLATQPSGVLLNLPLPKSSQLWPNNESQVMYQGMAHWMPMLNGYSGLFPPSYLELIDETEGFPDARAIAYLRRRGVQYVLVRQDFYTPEDWARLRPLLIGTQDLELLGGFPAPANELVFALRPSATNQR